jgi:hypothetical protein
MKFDHQRDLRRLEFAPFLAAQPLAFSSSDADCDAFKNELSPKR